MYPPQDLSIGPTIMYSLNALFLLTTGCGWVWVGVGVAVYVCVGECARLNYTESVYDKQC